MSDTNQQKSPAETVRSTLYEVAAVMRGMMSDDAITARILLDPEITSCEQAIEALASLEEQLETLREAATWFAADGNRTIANDAAWRRLNAALNSASQPDVSERGQGTPSGATAQPRSETSGPYAVAHEWSGDGGCYADHDCGEPDPAKRPE